MAAISFLENQLYIDVSDIAVGTGGTYSAQLTKDQRQAFSNTGLTVSICDETDTIITTGLPYHASISAIDGNYYNLVFTFDQPFSAVDFSFNRKIIITNGTDTQFEMRVQVNYTAQYNYLTWAGNSTETGFSALDIVLKGRLNSSDANTIWRSILNSAINATNQIKLIWNKFYYKKYLPEIIDFAINAGSGLEDNTSAITRDSDNDISSILISYGNTSRWVPKTLISYTYDNTQHIIRILDDSTTVDEGPYKVLSSITISSVDLTSNVITQIGTITFNRSNQTQTYPNNLPNYKQYTIPVITGSVVTGVNS